MMFSVVVKCVFNWTLLDITGLLDITLLMDKTGLNSINFIYHMMFSIAIKRVYNLIVYRYLVTGKHLVIRLIGYYEILLAINRRPVIRLKGYS